MKKITIIFLLFLTLDCLPDRVLFYDPVKLIKIKLYGNSEPTFYQKMMSTSQGTPDDDYWLGGGVTHRFNWCPKK
jgi:hypothetical protein